MAQSGDDDLSQGERSSLMVMSCHCQSSKLFNKTKYFVLCRFDEVSLCSEYNEVNEEAESKRHERKC